MKSFSIKALALSFAVVAGSANAGIIDKVNTSLFGDSTTYVEINGKEMSIEEALNLQDALGADFPFNLDAAEKTVRDNNNGCVNAINAKVFGTKKIKPLDEDLFSNTFGEEVPFVDGGLPIFRSYLNFNNGYARAAVVTVAGAAVVAGISAAAYKTYKHFTKPAADATEEGDNVEANETTPEVA